jgi:hypothetical protein
MAKSRNESDGNPGILVADASPAPLIAKRIIGMISDGITAAGERIVRFTDR